MTGRGTVDPNTMLLLDHAQVAPDARVLILSAGDPALALQVTRSGTRQVDVYDFSVLAMMRLAREKRASDKLCFPDRDLLEAQTYDVALLTLPKGREHSRAKLWTAFQALRPGGKLYLVGPNDGGAKSAINDAATLFGRCVTLAVKARSRIGVAVRSAVSATFPAIWGDDPTVPQRRTMMTPGAPITVATMPGIFSWEHLDDGTQFLLEHLKVEPGWHVLDVGCGNGIIGAWIARSTDATKIAMLDDNRLAVQCAAETVRLNGIADRATVWSGDVYEVFGSDISLEQFDLIVSNPPFHSGFEVDTDVTHRIINGASDHLKPGGRLVIVANAFLKYETLIAARFPRWRSIARNNRYVVLEGSKDR